MKKHTGLVLHYTQLLNIAHQAIKPGRFRVMLGKILGRFLKEEGALSKSENMRWIDSNCTDFRQFAGSVSATLWQEAEKESLLLKTDAEKKLTGVPHQLGGAGVYPLLYFITRLMNPLCIVETGVAAGFSSYAFLAAIEKNGKGTLFSSDFPYFRLPHPEQYIGIVVPEFLKTHWNLYIEGDEKNIPEILKVSGKIDLFHYDSEKKYRGRKKVLSMITPHLSANAVVLIDDIQDNSFFYEYVHEQESKEWHIFKFQNKYIGVVGNCSDGSPDQAGTMRD